MWNIMSAKPMINYTFKLKIIDGCTQVDPQVRVIALHTQHTAVDWIMMMTLFAHGNNFDYNIENEGPVLSGY